MTTKRMLVAVAVFLVLVAAALARTATVAEAQLPFAGPQQLGEVSCEYLQTGLVCSRVLRVGRTCVLETSVYFYASAVPLVTCP